MRVITYFGENLTEKLLEDIHKVKRANDERVRSEEAMQLLEDQFEPGRKDLVGLVVAYDNDELVGGIKLFVRKAMCESKEYVLGGIGGVFTIRSYQRQGIATLMLGKAMLGLDELGADVAYLCTSIEKLEKLYWPFGFRHLKQGHIFVGKSCKRYTEYDGMLAMVKSIDMYQRLMMSQTLMDIGMGNW